MPDIQKTEVAVIGAGPGGYAAAFLSADLGMRTVMIDPLPNPGGVCLFRGCIPSKALLHVARQIREAGTAEKFGLHFGEPEIKIDQIRDWKNDTVKKLTEGLGLLARQKKVKHLRGKARFLDSHSIEIETSDNSGKQKLQYDHAILATGGYPAKLPGIELESDRIWYSSEALDVPQIPETLLVVGSGYIGLELGTFYAALGARVTLIEIMPGILPGIDRDLTDTFLKANENLFENIYTSTRIADVKEKNGKLDVFFESENGNAPQSASFDNILAAIGRKPYTSGLDLDNTKVELNERGYVKVNKQRQTDDPAIHAVGDLTGDPLLAHKATHEGRTAAEDIAGLTTFFDPAAIPAVEYTDPEIAVCGLSETEAEQQNKKIETAKFPWQASGRALTMGRNHGLTKLIIDPDTERILGMGIVGADAGELISEGVLAIEMAAVVKDLALSIHPHPTLSETLMEAAEAYYGKSTHFHGKRRRRKKKK